MSEIGSYFRHVWRRSRNVTHLPRWRLQAAVRRSLLPPSPPESSSYVPVCRPILGPQSAAPPSSLYRTVDTNNITYNNRHSKPRPATLYKVLPPGEFNGMNAHLCRESLTTIVTVVFFVMLLSNKIINEQSYKHRPPRQYLISCHWGEGTAWS